MRRCQSGTCADERALGRRGESVKPQSIQSVSRIGVPEIGNGNSMSRLNEREDRAARSHREATAVIEAERAARAAKTARLRALRLANEEGGNAPRRAKPSPKKA